MNQIQIFIISDNQGMRQGLSSIFTPYDSFQITGMGRCAEETFNSIQQTQPDVILYGLETGEDVTAVIHMIKEVCPYTKVIVFGTSKTEEEVRTAIHLGIDGCIPGAMLPRYLVSAIELTCKTGIMCIPWSLKGLLEKKADLLETADDYKIENDEQSARLPLTSREIQIYKLIVQNYSNKDIGNTLFISQPTVKTHVSSILRKLSLKNRTKVIVYEMQHKHLVSADDVINEI